MNWRNLEEEFHKAVQRCCLTSEDRVEAEEYFISKFVVDLIDDALEE